MRQILFKGKRVDNGEWVYGSLLQDRTLDPDDISEYSIWSNEGDGGWFAVIPESVGQFTGLLDKNGDRIFEGDYLSAILKSEKFNYEVYFDNGGFMMKSKYGKWGPIGRFKEVCNNLDIPLLKITGNIHDNEI